jgi:hypothetical protein
MSDTETHARRIEFVCAVCLHSAYALDIDPRPRCPRCLIRMTPDSDEPPRRANKGATRRPVGRPPQPATGRPRDRPQQRRSGSTKVG